MALFDHRTVRCGSAYTRGDPPRGVTLLNPPGPEGSKGRQALSGARGVLWCPGVVPAV